jgi:integrase
MKLGDLTAVSLDAAREAARQHAASIVRGGNPAAERQAKREAPRVGDLIEAYLPYAKEKQRPRSYRETERYLTNHCKPLHREVADQCPRAVIAALLERVARNSGTTAANRCRAALSSFWVWGLKTGRLNGEANPVAFTVKHQERSRDRVLSDAELKAIWAATGGTSSYDRIVRLCLLTGCRRDEIGGLCWDEIGDEWITISADRMKGKLTHEVPLLPAIAACLPQASAEGGTVFGWVGNGFNGWSESKARLDDRLTKAGHQLAHWTLHDLRRTLSTRLHDAGTVQPVVIEALLAHKQPGVAGVYNRASFRQAKREALARWLGLLEGIVGSGADG